MTCVVDMKAFSKRVFLCVSLLLPVVIICLSSWLKPVHASSPNPRVIQLEFKVNALQAQINQLQSQLSRSSNTTVSNTPLPSAAIGGRPAQRIEQPVAIPGDLSFDAQFDNLATLVIEINQRLIAIEGQLSDSPQ